MSFEYAKLKGRIVEKYGTREKFADIIGLSTTSLSLKLNGKTSFSQSDILLWCRALDIDVKKEAGQYFFT